MSSGNCLCGQLIPFSDCCEPYILGVLCPPTAETLMRSRYSAYATRAIPYILQTTHPKDQKNIHISNMQQWLTEVTSWDKLEIIRTKKGKEKDSKGWVEFIAHYQHLGKPSFIHENSLFTKVEGTWMYKLTKP